MYTFIYIFTIHTYVCDIQLLFRPCGSTTNQSITFQEIQPYLLSWWHVVALISRSEVRSHNVRQLAACRCDRKACPETSVHPWRHQHHRSTNGQNPSNIRFDCCLQAYYSFNSVCVCEKWNHINNWLETLESSIAGTLWDFARKEAAGGRLRGACFKWLMLWVSFPPCTIQVAAAGINMGRSKSQTVQRQPAMLRYHHHMS